MKCGIFLLLAGLGSGIISAAQAQVSSPYLKAAYFYVSVDDWADMWLNDTPIIDSQRRTGADKGPKEIKALTESLCLFRENNILAIEVDDSTRPHDSGNDYAGIAYVLDLEFSDGTRKILTSDETDEHRAYYVPSHEMGNPTGWQRFSFNDRSWAPAQNTGNRIPNLAILDLPQFGGIFQFLSASSPYPKVQSTGEKHLFRRKFSLDISPNPNCDSPGKSSRIEPMVVSQPDRRHPVAMPPPTPTPTTSTLLPLAVASARTPGSISFSPTATETKLLWKIWVPPTPTPTYPFIPSTGVAATWTSIPGFYSQTVTKVKLAPKIRMSPTPTFTHSFVQSRVVIPTESSTPVVAKVIFPTWTPTFTVAEPLSEGQTIVFNTPPANIYMSFADGPGLYRLEIFDGEGHHLRNLFEKKVVAQQDAWAEWDGKNDGGQDLPVGLYYVVFSKGDRELRKITVLRT